MFHYLFTNDLRISILEDALKEAARCFYEDRVPTAEQDKNALNNMHTLGFYFNFTKESNCTKECCRGNVRKVVLNFIKKFQFPNPRTPVSLKDCINDGIQLAPLRLILQCLYMMKMVFPNQAYLTNKEIVDYIFSDEDVAKKRNPDIFKLVNKVVTNRVPGEDAVVPDDAFLKKKQFYWNQCRRQVREMVKVLTWSGCAAEDEHGNILIKHDSLTRDNEADLFEVITYSGFWEPDLNKDAKKNIESYQKYMDIEMVEMNDQQSDRTTSSLVFNTQLESEFQRDRIIFGAPGTGKSYKLEKDRKKLLKEYSETNYERVTFHPDYSYANFVGTYKPVMVERTPIDSDTEQVLSVLNDGNKTAQEKYDLLYERFKDEGLTRLPILLGLYTDEPFKTKKQDGSDTAEDNTVERNHGRAIRKYVHLITKKEKPGDIAYEYVPGPFMRVYVNALKSARTANPKPYLLIIEEINRANVAAVFGDIFQLLDRDDNNASEYPVQASEDIKKYLAKELDCNLIEVEKILIPDNMFIWATMNSADQGVFPMDTAFKRRWDFTYLGIDDNDEDIRGKYVTVGLKEKQRIEWNALRKAINDFLAGEGINEDKQLGPYFIPRNIAVPADGGNEINSKEFCRVFKNKVLMYLFEDAARQKRSELFAGVRDDTGKRVNKNRYSKICEAFDSIGINIFSKDITGKVKSIPVEDTELPRNNGNTPREQGGHPLL